MTKIINTAFLICAAATLVLIPIAPAAEGVKGDQFSWNFDSAQVTGKPVETLKAAGWNFNPAAEATDAVSVKTADLGVLHNYLAIYDNDPKATPELTVPFGPQPQGEISLKAALFAVTNQFGMIKLMQGPTVLAQILFKNDEGGSVKTGSGETAFGGPNWMKRGGEIRLVWHSGTVDISVEGLDQPIANAKFLTDGTPDAVVFSAGFGTGTNKGMAIDDLHIGFPRIDTAAATVANLSPVAASPSVAILEPNVKPDPFLAGANYRLANAGKVLDSGGEQIPGKAVRLYASVPSPNLDWLLIPQGAGFFKVKSRSNGFILDGGNIRQEGTEVLQASNGYAAQYHWKFTPAGEGSWKIQNRLNQLFLSNQSGKVVQLEDGQSPALLWTVAPGK